jgi:hypothetical protein
MDLVLQSKYLKPAVRRALKFASTLGDTNGVRVVSVKGGFRLQSTYAMTTNAPVSTGYRRAGPIRLGVMAHLSLKLDD